MVVEPTGVRNVLSWLVVVVLCVDGSRLSFTVVQAESVTKATIASSGNINFFINSFLILKLWLLSGMWNPTCVLFQWSRRIASRKQ